MIYPMWMMAFWTHWNHWQQFEGAFLSFRYPHFRTHDISFFFKKFFFLFENDHHDGKPSILFALEYCHNISAMHSLSTSTLPQLGVKNPANLFRLPKWQLEGKIVVVKWNCTGFLVVSCYRASSSSQTVLETPVLSCIGEFSKGFRAGKLAEAGSTFS